MHQLDELDEDNWGTVFRDVILLALIGFVAMVIIMLPHIKPTEVETQDHKAPGNVIVELHWPSNQPFDVDLWVKAPREAPRKLARKPPRKHNPQAPRKQNP